MTSFTFKDFNLSSEILKNLETLQYKIPTPVQVRSIPHLMDGKDLLGIAQTGTGKTAAYGLPVLHRLLGSKVKVKPARFRSLIITPTRELASQINTNMKFYSQGTAIRRTTIFGGVSPQKQIMALSRGVELLVVTPGRFLDLMSSGHLLFDQLEICVLDEADRMLDMGFIKDVKKIITRVPKKAQMILFSATMSSSIENLTKLFLKNAICIKITPEVRTVEKIQQKLHMVEKFNKPLLLRNILKDRTIRSMLVFTKTKYGADRLVRYLDKNSIDVVAIHGNKSQSARERALKKFRLGEVRVLVATDIASRGIDVADIDYIINYNLPDEPESYVHRIGRTARAGKSGVAISFCDKNELSLLKSIERFIHYKIPKITHPYHVSF